MTAALLWLLAPVGFVAGVICAGAIYQDVLRAAQLDNRLCQSMIERLRDDSRRWQPRRDGNGRFVK